MEKMYMKKPMKVYALQFTEHNIGEVDRFTRGKAKLIVDGNNKIAMAIETLEGTMTATYGDFIIKGIQGEFYPCKADIFHQTYEEIMPYDLIPK